MLAHLFFCFHSPLDKNLSKNGGLRFDFDIDASRKRQCLQSVNRFSGRIEDVDQAFVGAHLELFARLAVDVWRAQHSKDFAAGWQRDGPCNAGAGALGSFDNVGCRAIENTLIIPFEANADLLLGGPHGLLVFDRLFLFGGLFLLCLFFLLCHKMLLPNNFFLDLRWHFFKVAGLHRISRAARCERAQLRRIAEHLA